MIISILQWNIWYQENIENVLELIKQTNADIVCLQELTIGHRRQPVHPNTPDYIAQGLGYNSAIATFNPSDTDKNVIGNGIFTKFPIFDTRKELINSPTGSGGFDDENRMYVEAKLQLGNSLLKVGTVHMSYTHEFNATARKLQETDSLLKAIQENNEHFILTGDFNAPPASEVISRITTKLRNLGPNHTENTWTTKPFSYGGFSEDKLAWRLDYVFGTQDVEVVSAEIVETEFSDHLPILIRIKV